MSEYFRIFCIRDVTVSAHDISRFVAEGSYFENDPKISVSPAAGPATTWAEIEIQFDASLRPIVVHNTLDNRLINDEIEETMDSIRSIPEPITFIRQHLAQTKQIIAFEVLRASLTEDAWEMLDGLEAFIAARCGGIIYIQDEGFYDSHLKLIAKV